MSAVTKGIFIVGAKRTAFGTFGGSFKNTSATTLQVAACKATLESANVKPELVDSVVIGNVLVHSSVDGGYLPRHVSLHSGVPIEKPALGVNRLCGSGFQAVVSGALDILSGAAQISLTGGVDNMSQAPFMVRNTRFGTALGVNYSFEDSLWQALTDTYCKLPMALTAENLAVKYNIDRETVDKFALRSQQNTFILTVVMCQHQPSAHISGNNSNGRMVIVYCSQAEGAFAAEIVSFKLKVKGKEIDFAVDEHPKPNTTMESLAKLPTVLKKDGVVTAGSASGICDGAASVLIVSESAVTQHNLKPLARLVAYSTAGVPPEIMGFGPVPAIQNLLKAANLSMNDIDLIEINEAFGVQALACAQVLNIDMNKFNVNGGAIPIGHPLAASGARITGHLVHELRRKNLKRAIGSACIGGGQGIAVLIEAV